MNMRVVLRVLLPEYLGMVLVLLGLIGIFSITTDYFFSPTTFWTIANQVPAAVIVAVGMTYVLMIAEIDLSVGSVLALSGAVLGVALVEWQLPIIVAVGLCLGVGLACGAANGLVTLRWSLPSFIVTLGMLEAARGGAYLVTGSQTFYIGSSIEAIGERSVFGVGVPFLLAILSVVVAQLVLSRTVFGRYVAAIGMNEEAVRLSGINTRSVKLVVFMIASMSAALAAVIHSSRLAAADPNAAIGFELEAIAAVVIGGTSLMGGRGSVVNSFFGVLIIAVLGNGLIQIGADEPTKRLITGCVIVAAVIIDYYRRRLNPVPSNP